MDARKAVAMQAVIRDFAITQFAVNGVSHEEAALVMDGVCGYFTKAALDSTLMACIKPEKGAEDGNMDDNKDA